MDKTLKKWQKIPNFRVRIGLFLACFAIEKQGRRARSYKGKTMEFRKGVESRIGIVSEVREGEVVVRISQVSACSGCHAKEFCCSTDCAEREVVVRTDEARSYALGEEVLIEGKDSMGRMAVCLSFVLPLLLLVLSLVLSLEVFALGELWSIFLSFCVLGAYLIVLRLCNVRLERVLAFTVRKI